MEKQRRKAFLLTVSLLPGVFQKFLLEVLNGIIISALAVICSDRTVCFVIKNKFAFIEYMKKR